MLNTEVAAAGLAAMWEYFENQHSALAIKANDKGVAIQLTTTELEKIPGEATVKKMSAYDGWTRFSKTISGVEFFACQEDQ